MLKRRTSQTIAMVMALCVMPVMQASSATIPLAELLDRPYLDLAKLAPRVSYPRAEREALREQLERERKSETGRLKNEERALERQVKERRDQLDSLNREASTDSPATAKTRNRIHCEILSLEKKLAEKRVELKQGMPVAFDNKLAKIDFIEQWPARKTEIARVLAEGRARQRPFGNVEDIGVREVGKDQEKDIKLGEDALREMKLYRLMPPAVEDKETIAYVQRVADRIAANSDVKVPVKLTVLRSKEINAFALPGGFLFVNTGLIQKADSESELAGVIAHELAHVSGRHGAKLMKRATIANLMYQMAQIAVMVGTGGFGSIGAYYLFQAGFLGLGLLLDLNLLGVSREFEAEADQLGAQYAWKAGYDPRGFITFFDKMASEKGYIQSASFFRTHPPFFERLMSTVSEIEYLPASDRLILDTSGFQVFQRHLAELPPEPDKDAPKLREEPACEEPGPAGFRSTADDKE